MSNMQVIFMLIFIKLNTCMFIFYLTLVYAGKIFTFWFISFHCWPKKISQIHLLKFGHLQYMYYTTKRHANAAGCIYPYFQILVHLHFQSLQLLRLNSRTQQAMHQNMMNVVPSLGSLPPRVWPAHPLQKLYGTHPRKIHTDSGTQWQVEESC